MEDFNVIQALVRTAMTGNREAVLHQVDRLADDLAARGDAAHARTLRSMATKARKSQPVEPIDLTPSGVSTFSLERLGTRTSLPVDRESGAPLCEVVFPSNRTVGPILDPSTNSTLDRLLDEWRRQEMLRDAGLPVAQTLLLFGPPGTGKTTLALHLASQINKPAVIARLDGLISSLLGNTSRNLGALFDFCNRYDVVLILDEFDAVAKIRDDANEVGEIKRVVNALLQNIDRRTAIGVTVGITNHEHLLDKAIWRRFEHQLKLPLPAEDIRRSIARNYLVHSERPDSLARIVGWASSGLSGAETRTLALALMKTIVLAQDPDAHEISALRATMQSVGPKVDPNIAAVFGHNDHDLASLLLEKVEGLSSGEVAYLFGKDRRTVTRWQQQASA